jgi:hypothetical protein
MWAQKMNVLEYNKLKWLPEILDGIDYLIVAYGRISTKKIAATLAISWEWVGYIIHEILDMRKLSAKFDSEVWPSACFTSHFRLILGESCRIFNHFITGWNGSQPKEQCKEWRHSGSLRSMKLDTKATKQGVFWDKDGVLLIYCLEKGATVRQSTTLHSSTNWNSDWSPNLVASLWKESCFFNIRLPIRWPLCTRNWQIFTLKFCNTWPHLFGLFGLLSLS